MLQRAEQDGYSLVGAAVQILDRSDADGPLVEAPSLVRSADGVYVLFFSSNCYSGSLYDLSYATAQHVDGPYTKSPAPLLVTPNQQAPGAADVNIDGTKLVFHADVGGNRAQNGGMYAAEISIQGTSVSI
jgi:beta-xylosidase